MEFEEIIKFVWGAIIIVIFVVSRFKGKRVVEQSDGEREEEGSSMPLDLEQLLGRVQPNTPKSRVTPAPQPIEVKSPTPIFEDEISDKKESKKLELDMRQAVIMSEILTPKFKDE